MRRYNNLEEVERDLEILKLKRDITIEELKLVKEEFKDDFSVSHWVQSAGKLVAKLGLLKMAKKII